MKLSSYARNGGNLIVSEAVYIQADIFPIAALIVVLYNLKRDMSYTWRKRCFATIIRLTVGTMLCNMVCWKFNGLPGKTATYILWIFNTAYYIFMLLMSFMWFLYVYDKVTNGSGQWGIGVLPKAVPFLIGFVFLMAAPSGAAIFYIDDNNMYCRGRLHFVSTAVAAGYFFAACVFAFAALLRAVSRESREESLRLVLFGMFPLAGGVVQLMAYGVDLLWQFTTAALVMVYLNIQQQNVSRDGMTGLNNRRRLDEYVNSLSTEHLGRERLCYSIMDIDNFKQINDRYGHQMGDKVICLVADVLKVVYGNTRSFIARYGGDEFVIISKGFGQREAEHHKGILEKKLLSLKAHENIELTVEVSMGSAFFGEDGGASIREMMELADARMYEIKKLHHGSFENILSE